VCTVKEESTSRASPNENQLSKKKNVFFSSSSYSFYFHFISTSIVVHLAIAINRLSFKKRTVGHVEGRKQRNIFKCDIFEGSFYILSFFFTLLLKMPLISNHQSRAAES
jgi:hypothetical protein